MPIFDLDMTFNKLKSKLKQYLWEHFLNHFDVKNNCTLHYQCPCSRCHQSKPPTINLDHLQLMFVCKHKSIANLLFICNSKLWHRLPAVLWCIYIIKLLIKINNNSFATIYHGWNITIWLIMCLYRFHELLTQALNKLTVYLVLL